MSTKSPAPAIDRPCLSSAWIAALQRLLEPGNHEGTPSTVSFSEFGSLGFPSEDQEIRTRLDEVLKLKGGVSVDINAAMIFPLQSLHLIEARKGRRVSGIDLAEYYQRHVYPKLRSRRKLINGKGTYFLRMIAFGKAPESNEIEGFNQLEELLRLWSNNPRLKQSTLQIAIRDPIRDLNGNPRRPFPCLQQVGVGYDRRGVSITGFYPTQSILDRGYGNYLGLAHLGWFISRTIDRPLARVTCMSANPFIGTLCLSKTELRNRFGDLFEK